MLIILARIILENFQSNPGFLLQGGEIFYERVFKHRGTGRHHQALRITNPGVEVACDQAIAVE